MQINIVDTCAHFSFANTHTNTHKSSRGQKKRMWSATGNQITDNNRQPWFCVIVERSHLRAKLHLGHKPHAVTLIQMNLINALTAALQGMYSLKSVPADKVEGRETPARDWDVTGLKSLVTQTEWKCSCGRNWTNNPQKTLITQWPFSSERHTRDGELEILG